MTLNASRTDACVVDGRRYRLRLTVKRVLTAMDVAKDGNLESDDKADAMLRILVKWPRPRSRGKREKLLQKILDILQGNRRGPQGPETLNLTQDAPLIRAAFLQAYHIDLENEDIHWEKFLELLQAVPESTTLARIIEIRGRPIPKATRFNEEERASLMRAKRAVAIKNENQTPQQSADAIAALLIAIAKRR